jgi:large subunit ribosomal protein L4
MAQREKAESSSRREKAALATRTAVVFGSQNEQIGEVKLAPEVFGVRMQEHLLYEAVKRYRAGGRRGTHMTKNRALVSGSGRKPWRQKGTGRARAGEARNPLWRHGGTVFGPLPRDYRLRAPRSARFAALRSALSHRVEQGALKVVQGFKLSAPKARELRDVLRRLGIAGKALLIDTPFNETLQYAGRNLVGVRVVDPYQVNVYQVMDCRTIVISQEALEKLEERLAP